jgi:hypothetical protein
MTSFENHSYHYKNNEKDKAAGSVESFLLGFHRCTFTVAARRERQTKLAADGT